MGEGMSNQGTAKVLKTMDGDILYLRLTPLDSDIPTVFFGHSIMSISPSDLDDDTALAVVSFLTGESITMENSYKEVMSELGILKYFDI